jgi:hypothetical protein
MAKERFFLFGRDTEDHRSASRFKAGQENLSINDEMSQFLHDLSTS